MPNHSFMLAIVTSTAVPVPSRNEYQDSVPDAEIVNT